MRWHLQISFRIFSINQSKSKDTSCMWCHSFFGISFVCPPIRTSKIQKSQDRENLEEPIQRVKSSEFLQQTMQPIPLHPRIPLIAHLPLLLLFSPPIFFMLLASPREERCFVECHYQSVWGQSSNQKGSRLHPIGYHPLYIKALQRIILAKNNATHPTTLIPAPLQWQSLIIL